MLIFDLLDFSRQNFKRTNLSSRYHLSCLYFTCVKHDNRDCKCTAVAKNHFTTMNYFACRVLDAKTGAIHELFSSVECKGITGTDQRRYILDILRSTPVDLNFVPLQVRHRHHVRPTGGCADDDEVVLCEEGDSESARYEPVRSCVHATEY